MNKKVSFILPSAYAEGATHGVLVGDFNNWNTAEGYISRNWKMDL
jgi:hypothetical protein